MRFTFTLIPHLESMQHLSANNAVILAIREGTAFILRERDDEIAHNTFVRIMRFL